VLSNKLAQGFQQNIVLWIRGNAKRQQRLILAKISLFLHPLCN